MALEQFKTQVLLLHSQQSTLDALGAGFNDKYSVHFATSGSEALTTLGETPIHIIVSAQDLPGMSGLEALREAKKRSPDTIGILLAGSDSSEDLEALVGDQEVFQIVRGAVQPDALIKIVENAARRMRMLTISKSANDNAANVDSSSALFETVSKLRFPEDDGTGEHIIMETMDNGTTIISDGTGRMPALKPEKIQVTPEAGGRGVDVLVLTKDSEFLDTVRESARGLHKVHHAVTGQQAQDAVRNNRVGVLVTDAAIAGSKVELLTQSLRAHSPRLVAIVAGRRDDGDSLMELINRGQVYRFLLKPVSPGRARLAIEASVKYHLEAPQTSFKAPAGAARPAAPVAKKAAPPAPKPAAAKPAAAAQKPAPKPAPKPASQPAPQQAAPPAPARPAKPADADRSAPPAAKKADRQKPKSEPAQRIEPRLDATGTLRVPDEARRDLPSPRAADAGKSAIKFSPPVIGAAVVGVALVAALLWLFLSGDADLPEAATGEPTATAVDPGAADDVATDAVAGAAGNETDEGLAATPEPLLPAREALVPSPADDAAPAAHVTLLDNARFARDSGRIVAPAGDNAVEWYVAAREAAPDNAIVRDELAALVERLIGMTESALLDGRLGDARDALDMVELASPQNARLAFLNAQLSQIQLRDTLDRARAAMRDARFEDAGALLIEAERIPGADAAVIGELSEELAAARSAQQVDDVLARANERLAAGSLTAPSNDNARYFFELALANDPGNVAAAQGLLVVASKLVLNARAAIDRGEFDAAAALLEDARTLDPAGAELQATEDALAAGLAARAEAERQAELERQRAEQQAAAERAAAEDRRRASADLSTADSGTDGGAGATTQAPVAAAAQAPADGAAEAPAEDAAQLPAAADAAPTLAGTAAAAETLAAAGQPPAAAAQASKPAAQPAAASAPDPEPQPIAVSQLTRVNYVAPRYPRNAQRRNVSGWVDIGFTVTAAGSVADIDVIDSTPGSVFDDAAVDAVEKWRFEPVIEDGRAVPKRVAVRMSFSLQ